MRFNPIKQKHHGEEIWTNLITENSRKTECLCLNCNDLKECPKAKQLYKLCISEEFMFMMTRCRDFKSKGKGD